MLWRIPVDTHERRIGIMSTTRTFFAHLQPTTSAPQAQGQGPSLPSAKPPGGKPCGAGGLVQPAPGRRTDRRFCDASTAGQQIRWPGTSRNRSTLSQAHASCSSFRPNRAEHPSRASASDDGGKTTRASATERKALIFRALKHVFAGAVCLTCHRGSYISRAPLGTKLRA